MVEISMSELKMNLKKYTEMAENEEVVVTKNGKPYVKITNYYGDKLKIAQSLFGIIKNDRNWDEDDYRNERLSRI